MKTETQTAYRKLPMVNGMLAVTGIAMTVGILGDAFGFARDPMYFFRLLLLIGGPYVLLGLGGRAFQRTAGEQIAGSLLIGILLILQPSFYFLSMGEGSVESAEARAKEWMSKMETGGEE